MDEARIVTRQIEVTWGGEQKVLPVLAMEAADKWRAAFVKEFPDDADAEVNAAVAMNMAAAKLLKLMLAYDPSKVLGTREWIRANVTDEELVEAFVEVYRRCFRLSRLPIDLVHAMSAQSQPAKSPNGLSPTGTLTPINSAPASPTNS